MHVYTHTHTHPSPGWAPLTRTQTHDSPGSRRVGKAPKYTRILYYINTHAGLYKYLRPPSACLTEIHCTGPPASPHSLGRLQGREKRGANHGPRRRPHRSAGRPDPGQSPGAQRHRPKGLREGTSEDSVGTGESLQFFTASPTGGQGRGKQTIKNFFKKATRRDSGVPVSYTNETNTTHPARGGFLHRRLPPPGPGPWTSAADVGDILDRRQGSPEHWHLGCN